MENLKEKVLVPGFKPIYKGIAPFMKYENGHGYYGVLLEEESSGKIQCHICGKTALNIAKHLFHKHKNMSPKEYRIETGLSLTTPLLSESTRKKIKNNFLDLTEKKKDEIIKRIAKSALASHSNPNRNYRKSKASLQTNNTYGTCPEQVKSQFYEIYNKLGKLPRWSDLSGRLRYIIETRFGSYEEAIVTWGISRDEYRNHILDNQQNAVVARREKDFFPKYTVDEVKRIYMDFFSIKNRFPTWGEVKQSGMPGRIPFKRAFDGQEKRFIEKQLLVIN